MTSPVGTDDETTGVASDAASESSVGGSPGPPRNLTIEDVAAPATPPSRPALHWIALAAVLVLVITGLVVWRAVSTRGPQQTNGVLVGPSDYTLGYEGQPSTNAWLSISGPQSYVVDGDRFTAGCTGEPPANDPNRASVPVRDTAPCQANPDLDPRGHLFVVRVRRAESQRPLAIDVADPSLHPSPLPSRTAGARVCDSTVSLRSIACPNDLSPRDVGFTTTFIVRAPDDTPNDPTDNPAICAAMFPADPVTPSRTPDTWERLCTVPAAKIQTGDYIVQVRSNADRSAPRVGRTADLDPSVGAGSLERAAVGAEGDGQNHFALRAHWDAGPLEFRGAGLTVNGLDHLVEFVSPISSRVTYPLIEVDSTKAGRTVRLTAFDLGDVSAISNPPSSQQRVDGVDLRVIPPRDSQVDGRTVRDLSGCRISSDRRDDAEPPTPRDGTCEFSDVPRTFFNGAQVTIDVPIPAGYSCEAPSTDCLLGVQVNYRGTPNDNVGWTATIT